MRAKSEYPTRHGDQNAIDGSDPVPPGVWFTPVLTNGFGFLRFRRTNENDVQFEADLVDINPGDVVTTIDGPYRPAQDAYGVGRYGPDDDATPGVCVWKLETNGDLVFIGPVVSSGPGTDTTAIHWGSNTDPLSTGIEIDTLGSDDIVLDAGGSNNKFIVSGGGNMLLLTGSGTNIELTADGSIELDAGADVSIDAQGVIELGLTTGQTFTVKDNSGNPMLQMTEGSPDLHLPTGGNVVFDL